MIPHFRLVFAIFRCVTWKPYFSCTHSWISSYVALLSAAVRSNSSISTWTLIWCLASESLDNTHTVSTFPEEIKVICHGASKSTETGLLFSPCVQGNRSTHPACPHIYPGEPVYVSFCHSDGPGELVHDQLHQNTCLAEVSFAPTSWNEKVPSLVNVRISVEKTILVYLLCRITKSQCCSTAYFWSVFLSGIFIRLIVC